MNAGVVYQALGANIAARREALSLTQAEVAQKIGLSRASLANIEAGRQTVALHYVYALTEALGLELAELLPAPRTLSSSTHAALSLNFLRDDLSADQRAQIENVISAAMASHGAKRGD